MKTGMAIFLSTVFACSICAVMKGEDSIAVWCAIVFAIYGGILGMKDKG